MTRDAQTPPATPEIQLLAVRCQLGEEAAFDELIDRWHDPLWTYVRSLARDNDQAREALQEIWLRVVRSIADLREPAALVTWLFRIARFVCLDRLRLAYAESRLVHLDDGALDEVEVPDLRQEDRLLVRRGLGRLAAPDREVLSLFYLQELDLRQVAAVLEVPVGTVKSRLFRARRALRDQLDPKGASR